MMKFNSEKTSEYAEKSPIQQKKNHQSKSCPKKSSEKKIMVQGILF